jgi:hypothetical protein
MIKIGKGIDLGGGLTSVPIKFDYTGKHPLDKLKKRIKNEINVGDLLSGSYEDALKWVLDQIDEVREETDIEDVET